MSETSKSKESNEDDFSQYRMYLIEVAKRNFDKSEDNENSIQNLRVELELLKNQSETDKEAIKNLTNRVDKLDKLTLELNLKASLVAVVVSLATAAVTNNFFKDLLN